MNKWLIEYDGILQLIQLIFGSGLLFLILQQLRFKPKGIYIHTDVVGTQIHFHIRNGTESNLHISLACFKENIFCFPRKKIKLDPGCFSNRQKRESELKFDNMGTGYLTDLHTHIKPGDTARTILELDKNQYSDEDLKRGVKELVRKGNIGKVIIDCRMLNAVYQRASFKV